MSAFCSHEHRLRWLAAATHGLAGAQAQDVVGGLAPCCEQCCLCGQTIPAGGPFCPLHEAECPNFSVMTTLCAQRVVTALAIETGSALPDRAFYYLELAAQEMYDAGTFPDLAELMLRVWAERANWADPPKP